jgi:hypothetical protein
VEQASGVDKVEGARPEGGLEDVPGDEADRGGERRVTEGFMSFADALGVGFEGGKASTLADALAQAFEPERRGAAGIEDVEAADVAKEVELAVAEGDQVVFAFLAFAPCQRIIVV